MYSTKAVEVRHDFSFLGIEDDKLVGVHVGDVKTPLRGVEALIVETDGWTRHGNIGDLLERGVI
jgi:hypothetical protein